MNVGENIRYYRKKRGLTQKKLAEITGIAEITIRQYESGKYEPKRENLYKIRQALNINLNQLIGDMPDYEESIKDGYDKYVDGVYLPKNMPFNKHTLDLLKAIDDDVYDLNKNKVITNSAVIQKLSRALNIPIPVLLLAGKDDVDLKNEIKKYYDNVKSLNFLSLCQITDFICEEYSYNGSDGYKITIKDKKLFISKMEANEIIESIKGSFLGLLGHKLSFCEEIISEN